MKASGIFEDVWPALSRWWTKDLTSSAMKSHSWSAVPVLSSSGILYSFWVISNSPWPPERSTSHTRRFVPPMSRARKFPFSWPDGYPLTQVTFIGLPETLLVSTLDETPFRFSLFY